MPVILAWRCVDRHTGAALEVNSSGGCFIDVMTTTTAVQAVSPSERCDRCGARAAVRAVLPGGDLVFCAHHGREHAAKLRSVAVEIRDDEGVLGAL